jgi:uncharacterized membrane protein YedE/YeeE
MKRLACLIIFVLIIFLASMTVSAVTDAPVSQTQDPEPVALPGGNEGMATKHLLLIGGFLTATGVVLFKKSSQ